MGFPTQKKQRILPKYFGDKEDRISRLPDELIHKVMSFLDAKEAVQASVLSKRWKLIWTTLPFLGFGRYGDSFIHTDLSRYSMFIRHVLSNRNHLSHISELMLWVPGKLIVPKKEGCIVEKFIEYAISHNVEDLNIRLAFNHKPYKVSTISSKILKKLKLELKLEQFPLESDRWDLPALTTLHLMRPMSNVNNKLPESWLTCLPALRKLRLDYWQLAESSFSFSLPHLTTLCLYGGTLPHTVWDLPALLSLYLDDVDLPENMSDMFSALVNLQNLSLSISGTSMQQDQFISCPQLLNLNIRTRCYFPPHGNIMVSAPKLCSFSSDGIFSITFGLPELENVNIKVEGLLYHMAVEYRRQFYQRFTCMLSGLGNAKNLSFDLESIEVLTEISDFLASFSSPFYNLKCLRLPQGYNESSISPTLRSFLLGGSPRATVVTLLPQVPYPEIDFRC